MPKVIAQSVSYLSGTDHGEAVVAESEVAPPEKIIITLPRQTGKEILLQIKDILKQYVSDDGAGLTIYLRIPQNGDFEEIKTKTKVVFKPSLKREIKDLVATAKIELI